MAAVKKLAQELKGFQKEPLDGVIVRADEEDLFKWTISMFGPPETLYAGGYFKAELRFPKDYPFSPPRMRMLTKLFHPNIYPDGHICISILHPPGEDELSGERPEERWNPTQTVKTIVLSVLSLLNEPNTASPANVDASVAYRDWVNKKSETYKHMVRRDVGLSRADAIADDVTIPETLEAYVSSAQSGVVMNDSLLEASESKEEAVPEDEDYYEDSDLDAYSEGDDDFEYEEDDA